MPEVLKPPFPVNQPVISHKNPIYQNNSLSTPKLTQKAPRILTNRISPRTLEKFLLRNPSKKSNQLKASQSLALTADSEEKPTKKEAILLQKIKLLEKENNNLKSKNHHLKALVQQFQERQSLVRDQKNETSTQIIQPLHKK